MSSEAVVITEQRTSTRKHTSGEHQDSSRVRQMGSGTSVGRASTPWSPDGSGNALKVQVRCCRDPLRVALAPWMRCQWRTKWRGHTFADPTSSDGLLATGVLDAETYELDVADSQLTVKGAENRIVELLGCTPFAAARLVAADERINRALAEALEPHASRDPGSREVLKSTSAACHPESQPQKKIALYTEQNTHCNALLSHTVDRRPQAHLLHHPADAGTRDLTHSVTTKKGPDTSTNETTRVVEARQTQDETGTDNVDDRSGDVS